MTEPVSEKIPNVGSLNMSEFSCRFQENYGVIHLSYLYIYIYLHIKYTTTVLGTFSMEQSSLPPLASPEVLWSKLMPQKVDAELNLQGIRDLSSPTSHGVNGSSRHTLKGTLNNMAMAGRSPPFFHRKYVLYL